MHWLSWCWVVTIVGKRHVLCACPSTTTVSCCSHAAGEVRRNVTQYFTQPCAAQIDPSNAGRYFGNAKNFFDQYLNQQIPHTPNGLAYPYHFGALRPTTQVISNLQQLCGWSLASVALGSVHRL